MPSQLSRAHIKNLLTLRKATKQVNRDLNAAIKVEDELKEQLYTRLLILIWMTWAECKMNVLLTEPAQVTPRDAQFVTANANSEIERWRLLLDMFFRSRYPGGSPSKPLDRLTLGHANYHRYTTASGLIDRVGVYFEIRNRLAHGQWHVALNYDLSATNQELSQSIWRLTKTDTLVLKRHLTALANILGELVASSHAFEAGFDAHIHQVDRDTKQFEGRMEEMRRFLLSRYVRPIAWESKSPADPAEDDVATAAKSLMADTANTG